MRTTQYGKIPQTATGMTAFTITATTTNYPETPHATTGMGPILPVPRDGTMNMISDVIWKDGPVTGQETSSMVF